MASHTAHCEMPSVKLEAKPFILSDTLVNTFIACLAFIMVVYHCLYLFYPMVNAIMHQNVHLGMAMLMLCLLGIKKSQNPSFKMLWVGLALLAVSLCVYIQVENERLLMWAGFPEAMDVLVGISLALVVTGLAWHHWGIVFPLLAGISVTYALWGHLIPGTLGHAYLEPALVLSNIDIGFEGVYGMMLNTSANMIFFFLIFGALFESVGIISFFQSIGRLVGGKMRGGAAIGSVASSSLLGMCTGGAMVNVALAGSFTMPLMVEAGFSRTTAGGIEACSSTGGGLTPPVMGVAIFIMASFLNVTYIELIPATIIPAVAFYCGLIFGVIAYIKRENIPFCGMSCDMAAIRHGAPVFIIPMGLLCVLLFQYYTPAFSAFWAAICLLLIASLQKVTRPTPKKILAGFISGCSNAASLAIVLAVIGIFVSMLNITGAGPKLSALINVLSGGSMLLTLFLTMLLCILLGCALPAPVAYMVVAMVVAPGLKDLGVPLIASHLFCFYFSFLSSITPPIAGSSMVAARMIGAPFMRTGWESFKFAMPFFVVPYFAIFNPVIILKPQNPVDAAIALVALFLAVAGIAMAAWGYFRGRLSTVERACFAASAILLTLGGLESGTASLRWFSAGFVLFVALALYRLYMGKAQSLFTNVKPAMDCVLE